MTRGEQSPAMGGRADLAAWQVGLKTARNVYTHVTGGVSNRAGLAFGGVSKESNRTVRLIPFIYSVDQAYVLELGHLYMRVIKENGYVLRPGVAVTGATNASPGVISSTAHGAVVGEQVTFAGVGGMTRLNGRAFDVNTVPTANSLTLKDFAGVPINTTDTAVWGAYTSGGTVYRVAQYTTPWAEADLPYITFAQQADVMRLACRGASAEYDEVEISRGNDHYVWTVTNPVPYGPRVAPPLDLVTAQNYGIAIMEVQIAATADDEVRLRVNPKRPPVRDGDKLRISGLTTVTELNGLEVLQSRSDPDGTNSDLWICRTNGQNFDTTAWAAGAGTHAETGVISTEPILKWRVTAVDENGEESVASTEAVRRRTTNPQETAPVIIKWTPPLGQGDGVPANGLKRFYVYKEKNGLYGFIGQREVEARTPIDISAITNANPGVVTTATPHGLTENDVVYVYSAAGMTEINATSWRVGTVGSPTTFQLQQMNGEPLDTTAWGVYTILGQLVVSDYYFEDDGIQPELEDPAPPTTVLNPFDGSGNRARAVFFHQGRFGLAGTLNDPLKVFLTQIGHYYNWNESEPRRPDDAMQFTLASARGAGVLHAVSLKDLFLFTTDGPWVSRAGDSGGYTLENLYNEEVSRHGSAAYPAPITADRSILYVHRTGRRVMDLAWDVAGAGYDGNDQALMAPHLFDGKRIVDWAWQDYPERLVWMVLDDGSLVSLTYLPKQDVFGWCRHDTDGLVEAVCCIPEAQGDAVYIAVNRGVSAGGGKRYFERLDAREFEDLRDAFFVDSGLSHDSPVAITNVVVGFIVVVTAPGHGLSNGDYIDFSDVGGMTELNDLLVRVGHVNGDDLWLMNRQMVNGADVNVSAITNANPAEVTTATAHGLTTGNVVYISGVNGMTEINDRFYRAVVTGPTTFEVQTPASVDVDSSAWGAYTNDGRMDLAQYLNGTTFTDYESGGYLREALQTVGGLDHLVGKTVVAVANGTVQDGLVVDSLGRVTLSAPAGRVHVGLAYTAEIETLDLLDGGGEIMGKWRKVTDMVLRLLKTRGIETAVPDGGWFEYRQRDTEGYDEPTAMLEGEHRITMESYANLTGRVKIRQSKPLPMTVLGVVIDFGVNP
jgi:hypothetical protein